MIRRQPRYSKGQRIGGRYLVQQGLMDNMGDVYLDEKRNSPFALKPFQDSSPDLRSIFQQEVARWIDLENLLNNVCCCFSKFERE